jgi:hypothetical protein
VDSLTGRLDDVAQTLSDTRRTLLAVRPAAVALGADTGGLPGRLGRALHDRWLAVLAARAREAADTAGRVGELGEALHTTAQRYAETDDLAARRLRRES